MHKVTIHTDCEFCQVVITESFLFATDKPYNVKKIKCHKCGRINYLEKKEKKK